MIGLFFHRPPARQAALLLRSAAHKDHERARSEERAGGALMLLRRLLACFSSFPSSYSYALPPALLRRSRRQLLGAQYDGRMHDYTTAIKGDLNITINFLVIVQ